MKKNVLREYLKNRKKDVMTIERDKYFTIEVDDVEIVKPKKKAKKGDK
jgi:hypothetical protein